MFLSRKKIILGATLTTGITLIGISSLGNSDINSQKPQIKAQIKLGVKYQKALIEEDNMWSYRFKDLKIGNPKHPDLLIARTLSDDSGTGKLQEGCKKIIDGEEENEWFEDFQSFCVMKNKDETNLINNKDGFSSKYFDFSKATKDKLSKGFSDIWEQKENSINEKWKEKMLQECQRLQNKMYVGDVEDKNFNSYCTN